MDDKLVQANAAVAAAYNQLAEVYKETLSNISKPLDDIISKLSKGIQLFSNSDLWELQLELGVEAYRLGNIKDQSSLKDMCATALYKEKQARVYSEAQGTSEAKKQQSVIDTVGEQAISMLYSALANALKTKCDEAHRLVNIIQSIQISRAAEAKISASPRSEVDDLSYKGE